MLFKPFHPSTKADTPDFVGAAYNQGQLEEEAQARKDAANSANVSGGIDAYNQLMGDNSPIRDYGRNLLGLGVDKGASMGDMSAALRGQEAMSGVDAAAGMFPAGMEGYASAGIPDVAAQLFPSLEGLGGAGVGVESLLGSELGSGAITSMAEAGLGLGAGAAEGAELANVAAGMFPEALVGAEGASAVAAGAGAGTSGAMAALGPMGGAALLLASLFGWI